MRIRRIMVESADATKNAARCAHCGYILIGLQEARCPECGQPFDRRYVANASLRNCLLPWEWREIGGAVRRLARTLMRAWIHPGRYFTSAAMRKDQAVTKAGKLIAACVLAALCFHFVEFVLDKALFFSRSRAEPRRALQSVVNVVGLTGSTEVTLMLMQLLPILFSVFLAALLLNLLFRGRSGAIRVTDFAALFSPAVALGALVWALVQVLGAFSHAFIAIVGAAPLAQDVFLVLLVWFCCRRLLSLRLAETVEVAIVCGISAYFCDNAVGYVVSQLNLLIVLS
jgi:hypothetical protein